MERTIILFDMDGVLLQADGYYRALQSSVRTIGRNIGIEEPILSREHIAKFEAAGVTHEWETLAICTAILLTQVWQIDPKIRIPKIINPSPDQFLIYGEDQFAEFLLNIDLNGISPTDYAGAVIFKQNSNLNTEHMEYLRLILGSDLDLDSSPTLQIFQEYVLGSPTFSETYHLPSHFNTESYLHLYDREALSIENQYKLKSWLESDQHQAVIFTNRPSQPPEGFFSPPDAELGAAAIGLQILPIVGAGSLSWLAALDSKPWDEYYKPHPVHTLAALQLAVGKSLTDALKQAEDLYHGTQELDVWSTLEGSRIFVFEDLTPGLISARSARQILLDYGIKVEFIFVGVSNHPLKRKSLSQYTDFMIDDLNQNILPRIFSEG